MIQVLFSANDPGGANAIAPVVGELKKQGAPFLGILSGPAREIFSKRNTSFIDGSSLTEETLHKEIDSFKPNLFLFGTSAGGTLEKDILLYVHDHAPSVAVLDFWGNYWQRFSSPGVKDFRYLPAMICIMDTVARDEMIAEGFNPDTLVVTGNPHFDHFADLITRDLESEKDVLFISQPLSSISSLQGFTKHPFDEFSVLEDIISAFSFLPQEYHLNIRLHPKEDAHKFDKYISSRVFVMRESTLEEELSRAGLVIGMSSPVLLQASAAGKRVLSYEPGLSGNDMLVSNRVGVTRRISSKEELKEMLIAYSEGKIPLPSSDMREFWPSGATSRVVEVIKNLV
jgi:hypothetical protein